MILSADLLPETLVTTLYLWALNMFAMPAPISPMETMATVARGDVMAQDVSVIGRNGKVEKITLS